MGNTRQPFLQLTFSYEQRWVSFSRTKSKQENLLPLFRKPSRRETVSGDIYTFCKAWILCWITGYALFFILTLFSKINYEMASGHKHWSGWISQEPFLMAAQTEWDFEITGGFRSMTPFSEGCDMAKRNSKKSTTGPFCWEAWWK